MAFPDIDITGIKQKLSQAFQAQGHTATVTLRGGAGTFEIKLTEGFRTEVSMTGGLDQQQHRVKFLADDWDNQSPGRPPQKGDQVAWLGQRRMIQENIRRRALSDELLMYVVEVRG